jgi:hypothetical protein
VLVSQSAYARQRGVSHQAVQKRTVTAGGPIPVHGPKKLIDPVEADALWEGTKSPQGEGGAEAGRREPFTVLDASTYLEAKTARMVALAKREALELRRREGELVDRRAAERQVEALAQQLRDDWRRWPSRVAPVAAQRFGLAQDLVLEVLDELVQAQCAMLRSALRFNGSGG